MSATACLPYDIDAPIRSEAVVLASFSVRDGSGFTVRMCRYPTAGVAWLWVQVFGPDGSAYTFNVDHLPCGPGIVDPDGAKASYEIEGVAFERSGDRNEPSEATVRAAVRGHASSAAPDAPGQVELEVTGSFLPFAAGGPSAPGRSEVHGRVRGSVSVDGVVHEVDGVGQWHEQLQDRPRFRDPFTYVCLIGERESLVGVVSGGRSRATLRDGTGARATDRLRVAGDGDGYTIRGGELTYTASVTHRTTIPLYGLPWRGTRVVAEGDGCRLAGMINSFDPSA